MQARQQQRLVIFLIAVVIGVLGIFARPVQLLEILELKTVDFRFSLRHLLKGWLGLVEVSDEVALIGVDQKSVDPTISKYADRWGTGGWLTRDTWRSALPMLTGSLKPSVVAYDVLLLPVRSDSRIQKGRENYLDTAGREVDDFLKAHPGPFAEVRVEPDFPKLQLLDLLDDTGNRALAFEFYNIESLRDEGAQVPRFVMAYNFTRQEVEVHARAWSADDPSTRAKVELLRKQAFAPSAIHHLPDDFPFADNASLPFDWMTRQPIQFAYVNVPRDPDGNLRRLPLIWGFRDPFKGGEPVIVPSMSLQACLLHLGFVPGQPKEGYQVSVHFGREVHIRTPSREIHIPIDRHGHLFLNFEGKIEDFFGVPYVNVFRYGNVMEESQEKELATSEKGREELDIYRRNFQHVQQMRGRVTFVGTTFTGGGDVGPCAIDVNTPFVFIHMVAADNMLRGSFLRPLDPMPTAALLFFVPLLVALASLFAKASVSARGMVYVLLGFEFLAFVLFYFNITALPMVLPGISILVTSTSISLYQYRVEQKGRLEIRRRFSAMVSGKALQYMEEHPDRLGGEKREATMFFSDVAGFTSVSEGIPPEQLSKVLNDYLTPMADLILAQDGYVNKFAGDGIMAVWGIFEPEPAHAARACVSALEQQGKIRELQTVFKEKYGMNLKVRMGLNTGIVSAGNMGSENRYEYTVMGDAVNFAARLEPANKDYGTRILIGERTRELAKEQVVTRRMDRIVVEGKHEPVLVYEVVSRAGEASDQQKRLIALFEEGLDFYWKRNWERAIECFEKASELEPNDSPPKVFLERAKEYQNQPPPDDWKGEYVRHGKY